MTPKYAEEYAMSQRTERSERDEGMAGKVTT
jgi:hypothetical protein